jgi:predicted RNA binding protein YcfA (HicA-like mRNA interferase family)
MPGKGAHMKFFHPDGRFTVVPLHPGEVSFGVFRKILKQIRMTEDEYREL